MGTIVAMADYYGSRSREVPVQVYEFPPHMSAQERTDIINGGPSSQRRAYRIPLDEADIDIDPTDTCWLSPLPWLFGEWCHYSRYHNGINAMVTLTVLGGMAYPLGLFLRQRKKGALHP